MTTEKYVCKFGGTSMADAAAMRQAAEIVKADPRRRYIVVSAPGKRSAEDEKITDLLYACHAEAAETGACAASFALNSILNFAVFAGWLAAFGATV